MTKSGKHYGKRRNCTFCAISSFETMFSKRCLLQRRQKVSIWGKGLNHLINNTTNVTLRWKIQHFCIQTLKVLTLSYVKHFCTNTFNLNLSCMKHFCTNTYNLTASCIERFEFYKTFLYKNFKFNSLRRLK